MINFDDHRKDDGYVDWGSYKCAKVAVGEACQTCGGYIDGWVANGSPQDCRSCRQLRLEEGEQTHSTRVRCPHCVALHDPWDPDGLACYPDPQSAYDDHSVGVVCPSCEKDFKVGIQVSHEFVSPPRVQSSEGGAHGEARPTGHPREDRGVPTGPGARPGGGEDPPDRD